MKQQLKIPRLFMLTRPKINQIYCTLMSVAVFVILLNSWSRAFNDTFSRLLYYWDIGVGGVILTLMVATYCWAMSLGNGKSTWKWYAGAIPVILLILRLICIKILIAVARNNQEFININTLNYIFFGVLMLYTAVITFCSKVKCNYRNILPNQTNIDTQIFKWLFIAAQIAVWVCLIISLPSFIHYWLSWWPTEAWVNDAVNQMDGKFNQYFE